MNNKSFYVTTPIYYVNDKPHIGHAYTTILADVLARYYRALNAPSFFLTGTDEHGQKVEKAAISNNMTPQEQCDRTAPRFQNLWKKLQITNDDFIRTTEERHKKIVKKTLQELFDKDLIYRDEYQGWYCVGCERFFTEKDLKDGKLCPDCQREVDEIVESNYFFRMSQYQEWLIQYIKDNPEFIQPSFRANETLGFLKKPLGDLCISRPKSRMSWGIELPFDKEYVCYVWFDALLNYVTAVGYGADSENFDQWWPASYHLIGKDILTTHTVYWPTMLKAMGLPMPKTIFAHGWWLIGDSKMSKSRGNVVNPMQMAEKYGVDAFRYFLMAEMSLGMDATFSEEAFVNRYNSDLANDLGNLLSRVVKMTLKQFDGVIPAAAASGPEEDELRNKTLEAARAMEGALRGMKLDRGIDEVMNAVRAGNKYMEKTAPWKLAKSGDLTRLGTVLYTASEALRIISGLLHPVMPGKMRELRETLGIPELELEQIDYKKLTNWAGLKPGSKIKDINALFMRVKKEDLKPANVDKAGSEKKSNKKSSKKKEIGLITIDEFFKSDLRTAKIVSAEKVEGADKLLKLRVEIAGEERQLVAGIAEFHKPEDILGKTVVVVANLKPAEIRGVESHGMLLAAKHAGQLSLVTVEGEVPTGAKVG